MGRAGPRLGRGEMGEEWREAEWKCRGGDLYLTSTVVL